VSDESDDYDEVSTKSNMQEFFKWKSVHKIINNINWLRQKITPRARTHTLGRLPQPFCFMIQFRIGTSCTDLLL
jgi:hypothetical protein